MRENGFKFVAAMSSIKMELLRYYYRYGVKFCFAGILVFTISTYAGYILAQIARNGEKGVEVKIKFGKALKTLDFMLNDPLVNIPWDPISEDNIDTFYKNKAIRVFITMATDDLQYDLRFFNSALENLRTNHMTKTQSNKPMTWANHPKNFLALDMAKGEHMRYISTIAPHGNVVTLLYMAQVAEENGRVTVQSLKCPVKHFYEWSTSVKLCREMRDNIQRFMEVEETCWNHFPMNKSVNELQTVETHLIYSNQILKNYSLFIHMVDNGLVDSLGNVYTGSLLIMPLGCNQRLPFSADTDWKVYAENEIEREVFAMTQFYDDDPTSFIIDSLPRIVPYLKFLWAHKEIKIHVLESQSESQRRLMSEVLNILGIESTRLVRGHIRSETIYLPQGGGCKAPNSLMIQILAQLFHQNIKEVLGIEASRNTILLLDSGEYKIHDFDTVVMIAKKIASMYSLEVKILSQLQIQALSLPEVMKHFYQASIIFGSPSSMMSNIVFCQPGTVVIETLCSVPYMTLGHLRVAYSLSLRYHAVPGNIGCSSGIVLDMQYIEDMLGYYMRRFNSFYT